MLTRCFCISFLVVFVFCIYYIHFHSESVKKVIWLVLKEVVIVSEIKRNGVFLISSFLRIRMNVTD